MSAILIFSAVFLAGGLFVGYVIAADRTRYLSFFDLHSWNDRLYLSLLPNFLQRLHDKGFESPFPRKLNALSAAWFKFRARGIVKERPSLKKLGFMDLHLNMQALLFLLKPYIDDAMLVEQAKIAEDRIISMPDTVDRDRLISFVEQVRAYRERFLAGLTKFDSQIIDEMRKRHFFNTLGAANAMFHEHGFDDLFVGLDTLRRWRSLEGKELVQELPALPKVPRFTTAAHLGAMPSSGESNSHRE